MKMGFQQYSLFNTNAEIFRLKTNLPFNLISTIDRAIEKILFAITRHSAVSV
jgi:hypothetical protein